MLYDFLTANRSEILRRVRAQVQVRSTPRVTYDELTDGIPLFLDQLGHALQRSNGGTETIRASAVTHAADLMRMGFTIARVVHGYGDICQAVTELADELHVPITVDEFHTFNRCLDDATAEAVTEYTRLRASADTTGEMERLGAIAHEMRNRLNAATLAFAAIKSGNVGASGSTGALLDRSLRGLRDLIDRSLTHVRVTSGTLNRERVAVRELVEDVEVGASLEARARDMLLTVAPVQPGLEVQADRAVLAAALTNLLTNAFKFSRTRAHVSLTTSATVDRVRFDVEDECGGLPVGNAEDLFRPFTQRGASRKGLGLGLSIARRGIEAQGGDVGVRDLPGKGCVFTITLPRLATTSPAGA